VYASIPLSSNQKTPKKPSRKKKKYIDGNVLLGREYKTILRNKSQKQISCKHERTPRSSPVTPRLTWKGHLPSFQNTEFHFGISGTFPGLGLNLNCI